MSRIGKKVIFIPKDVTIEILNQHIYVKGTYGTLSKQFLPSIKIVLINNTLHVNNIEIDKKSISEFNIRKDMILGLLVTLRRDKMYTFLEKLIKLYLPRIRDFKGLEIKHFDKFGNYHLGIKDKSIFPELDSIDQDNGYTISIVINSQNLKQNFYLLKEFGFPFREKEYL